MKNLQSFMICLKNRGYLYEGFEKHVSRVIFYGRESILRNNRCRQKKILPFVTQSHPALQNFKNIHPKTNLFHYITKENHLKISWMKDIWIRAIKEITWPIYNSMLGEATHWVSQKTKSSRLWIGVDRLVDSYHSPVLWNLLPSMFTCHKGSTFPIQYSQLVNLLSLRKVDLQHDWLYIGNDLTI